MLVTADFGHEFAILPMLKAVARGRDPMIPHRFFPILAAMMMAVSSVALAQGAPPAAPPPAANPVAQATLLGQFGDWGAYSASPGGQKVCFALSKPTAMVDNPPNRRKPTMSVYMFISFRSADKVKDEFSILVTGYKLKPNGDASLTVSGTAIPLFSQNDGAWVKASADEPKAVEALRKGSDATVKALTAAGTQTTDTFSLKGISQALDRAAQECP
jgi:invasion protein IalB